MTKFNILIVPIIAILLFSIFIALAPMLSSFSSSFTDLAPFSNYSYTGYSNTSTLYANNTYKENILKTVTEADNSDIAKAEYLYVKFHNANKASGGNITANVSLNSAIIGTLSTLYDTDTAYTWANISCQNGINTITLGSLAVDHNLTSTNATIVCATTLNGTDYSWLIDFAILACVVFILVMILIFSKILNLKKYFKF